MGFALYEISSELDLHYTKCFEIEFSLYETFSEFICNVRIFRVSKFVS
jgi:hypothetical protein